MEAIVDAIGKATYFIEGVIDLPACSNKLFFQRGPTFGSVDLLNPTDEKLELLTDACEPASFGRNHEDILDETYRKAGKLDVSDFAINRSTLTYAEPGLSQRYAPASSQKIGISVLICTN
ncbi:hypothetical protein ONZ45_g19562 [Pleurotus djamor]|nr:hypothetical protein ONZ45_g19562 [Pleurotus djamor]